MENISQNQTQTELQQTSAILTDKMEALNKQIMDLTKTYKTLNQKRNYIHQLIKAKRYSGETQKPTIFINNKTITKWHKPQRAELPKKRSSVTEYHAEASECKQLNNNIKQLKKWQEH